MNNLFQSGEIDVQQFDRVVQSFYEGTSNAERQNAQNVLTEFKSHPDAWQCVDRILDRSSRIQSKFIALGILENFIKVKWNLLPLEQRLVIRDYIVKLIIDSHQSTVHDSSSNNNNNNNRSAAYINKLDWVLVQILKKDWPTYWPTFIQEIVDSSLANETICENNMRILQYLSEEVFDYSDDYMTKAKMQKLRKQLMDEFSLIFDLCKRIFISSTQTRPVFNRSLLTTTLHTFLKFQSWISPDMILQQDLLQLLQIILRDGDNEQKNLIIQSFTEIVKVVFNSSSSSSSSTDMEQLAQHRSIIDLIVTAIYHQFLGDTPALLAEEDEDVLQSLCTLLTSSLTLPYIAVSSLPTDTMRQCWAYLLHMTFASSDEKELRQLGLTYWHQLILSLKNNKTASPCHPALPPVLEQLAIETVQHMMPPDAVLYVQPDQREFVQLSHSERVLPQLMQDVLCNMAELPSFHHPLQQILTDRIHNALLSPSPANWHDLYRCVWATGALIHKQAALDQSDALARALLLEKLYPAMQTHGSTDDPYAWVLFSCAVYIAEQSRPPFLMEHYWNLTYRLLERLFQAVVLQQQQPIIEDGIKEFCLHALLKLSVECKENMAMSSTHINGHIMPSFLSILLEKWELIYQQLTPAQLETMYAILGTVITAIAREPSKRATLQAVMNTPNRLITKAFNHPSALLLEQPFTPLRSVLNVVKINKAICLSAKSTVYQYQWVDIQPSFIQAYTMAAQYIVESKRNGSVQFKLMWQIRKQILELLEAYYSTSSSSSSSSSNSLRHAEDSPSIEDEKALMHLLSLPFDLVYTALTDFKNNALPAEKKEATVLNLLTTIVTAIHNPDRCPQFFQQVIDVAFSTTLPFITSNFIDYPEIRRNFYSLLKVLNECCFMYLFQTSSLFQLNIDSILWGTKHNLSDISHLALQICLHMINFVPQIEDEDISSLFFERYYVRILTDILEVLVDPDCRNGFEYQSQILARMLALVQEGEIYTRVFPPEQVSDPLMSNVDFLQQYVLNLLCNAFPLLQRDQIEVLVKGMFDYSDDLERFQKDIRDFLIDITEVGEAGEGQKREQEELNAELELLRDL
ncbi:CRM1 C terminal-domain-containing protein [Mycotypha africana]|uniref:CRM1 C terminal-domain-containing protein n=1 Tax=Mycotypha africana TaxID=64632 RepID=UPI002301502C|nr:CRM1 C terminal-domain-containing protein [Mycotypha africana]KAI8991052.1 CRM1 C terminal-domain-containing protein [Mycotypha africana]